MSNWRQTKSKNNNKYNYNHQRSSKPPLADPKFSVPEWEKEFCAVIGSIPWWRVVEVKRYMHIYETVVKWDDSAGEEAFNNAKSRFWAEKNSLTCDLSLPGPDLYIDDVDWDAEVVDTELYLDLEREPEPIIEEREPVVIIDPLLLSENTGHIWGTGWGDAEGIKPENSWNDQKCDADGWNKDSWGRKDKSWGDQKCDGWNKDSWERVDNSWGNQKCDGWNKDSWGRKENSWGDQKCDGWNKDSWGRMENSWGGNQKCDGWNKDPWGRKENSWGDQKGDGWNEDSWGRMENSWDDQKGDVWKKDSWGRKDNSWGNQKCDGSNKGPWGRQEKTETWAHNNNNSFNQKKVENWNGRGQGRGNRSWRKTGEVRKGQGDGVEDCRWGNDRGRSRGGFRQYSNKWGRTETF